jgi:hypothetical protein
LLLIQHRQRLCAVLDACNVVVRFQVAQCAI